MELKVKFLKWSAGIPVAILNSKTSDKIGAHLRERVSLEVLKKKRGIEKTHTVIDTSNSLVKENEIAVSNEIKKLLKIKKGDMIEVKISPPSKTLEYIKNKLENKTLSKEQIYTIIKDIVSNKLSEAEISMFISGMYINKMNFKETVALVEAISKNGKKLNIKGKYTADKHCIGGIAGNRTTPIVVSICAAAGLTIPKNSSRGITSATGTADVMEAITGIEFSPKEIEKIVKKTNSCIVWGGALGLVPADSKIIRIEKSLNIDPRAQLLASIMSKKLASGTKNILIDIPYGKFAKVNKKQAEELKKDFEKLGQYFNKNLKCTLTEGNQPIGQGIGAILELKDILKILKDNEGPEDLKEKSLYLSGTLLEMSGRVKPNKGLEKAKEILESGKAYKKFKEIVKEQGGSLEKRQNLGTSKYKKVVLSEMNGKIKKINNKKINFLARIAGCPADKKAGIFLHKKKGENIKKGNPLITIFSESKYRLKNAEDYFKKEKIFEVN